MDKNWTVERSLASNGVAFEIRRYSWPTPYETVLFERSPVLGMLTGARLTGASRPRDAGARTAYRTIGPLTLTPANIPIDVHGQGGQAIVAACQIAPSIFDGVCGGVDWDEDRLSACADIYGTPIDSLMTRLMREAAAPGFASDVILESSGVMIAVELARFFQSRQRDATTGSRRFSPAILSRITNMVEENPSATLELIASCCGVSIRTLTRLYKASTGSTIGALIAESRIKRAKALLGDPSIPIKSIAAHAGFSTSSSFSAAFLRACGVTPSAFRRRRARSRA